MSARSVLRWNKPAVYAAYEGPPNNWTKDEIDEDLFQKYDKDITQFTQLDPRSIMMYPIPAELTTDGFSAGWNTDLSDTDKSFIAVEYPR